MGLREQILNAVDRKVEKVETPEWGGPTHIRTLSHAERSRLNARINKMKGTPEETDAGGLMAATIICDESGSRVFGDDDAKALSEKSGAVLDRLVEAFRKLTAVTAEDIEADEKNSSTPPELQLAYELCLAGVAAHPDYLFELLTDRQWIGWRLWTKHFSTPQRRADLNSALERQVGMAGKCKKIPDVDELIPTYGKPRGRRKTPEQLFRLAEAAAAGAGVSVRGDGWQ